MELTRNGENLNRKICRKHYISNNTIPYNSASAFGYKLAAYRFYGWSIFEIWPDSYLVNELNKIKYIASDIGFLPHHINKLVYDMKLKEQKENLDLWKVKFCKFRYVPGLYERLMYALRKFCINLVLPLNRINHRFWNSSKRHVIIPD